jgi:glycine/D-amino acid oxidase-like deaminating enzyme
MRRASTPPCPEEYRGDHSCEVRGASFDGVFGTSVERLLLTGSDDDGDGERVAGVVLSDGGIIDARLGVVVALGAWTGQFLASRSGCDGLKEWSDAVVPRRGHLLELPPPPRMPPLTRGVMEVSYTKHYRWGGDLMVPLL